MPISATLPSEVRLIPARAGLNAVFALRKRNLQAGTAIYKIIIMRNFMLRKFLVIFSCVFFAINLACQSASQPNGNTTVDQSNLPEGLSTKPLPTNEERPAGIPDTANMNANAPKGGTPTPGIPDPKTMGKTPMPKNTPPIPGIPDEETLKRQMNQMKSNSNAVPPKSDSNSTKNQNAQPRTVRKSNTQFE